MIWERFKIRKQGKCSVIDLKTNVRFLCDFAYGHILTGKQRVFMGYKVIVSVAEKEYIGKDNWNLLTAVCEVGKCYQMMVSYYLLQDSQNVLWKMQSQKIQIGDLFKVLELK